MYYMVRGYTVAHIVGPKGQVVIAKEIRDRLGIKPGWLALQRWVDDHLEVYFLPPQHTRSLKGSLAEHIDPAAAQGLTWGEIRDLAWSEGAKDQESKGPDAVDGLS